MDRAWDQAAGGAGGAHRAPAYGQGTSDPVPLCPGCLSRGEVNPCEAQPRTEWEGGQDSHPHPRHVEGSGQGPQRLDRAYEDESDAWDTGPSSLGDRPGEDSAAGEGWCEGAEGLHTGQAARTGSGEGGARPAEAVEIGRAHV